MVPAVIQVQPPIGLLALGNVHRLQLVATKAHTSGPKKAYQIRQETGDLQLGDHFLLSR